MALPLKYNIRNIIVRKGNPLATAFTIGLTVAVFLMVMALARGIDLTLSSSGEPLNLIVLPEGSTVKLNISVPRENFNDLMYLDGVDREADKPLAAGELVTLIYKARKGMSQGERLLDGLAERVLVVRRQDAPAVAAEAREDAHAEPGERLAVGRGDEERHHRNRDARLLRDRQHRLRAVVERRVRRRHEHGDHHRERGREEQGDARGHEALVGVEEDRRGGAGDDHD